MELEELIRKYRGIILDLIFHNMYIEKNNFKAIQFI